MKRTSPLVFSLSLGLAALAAPATADHRDPAPPRAVYSDNPRYLRGVGEAADRLEIASRAALELARERHGRPGPRGYRHREVLAPLAELVRRADRFENEWDRHRGDRSDCGDEFRALLAAHHHASRAVAEVRSERLRRQFDLVDAWMDRLTAMYRAGAYRGRYDDRDRRDDHVCDATCRHDHDDRRDGYDRGGWPR